MSRLRQVQPSSETWSELLHAEVAYLLRTAGVPVLHIKGPTVALWLYEPGERAWGDVDILVPPTRMHDALAALTASGFLERYPGVNRLTSTDHAITLARPGLKGRSEEVDVHDRFEGMDDDPERTFAELWSRREPVELAHSEVIFPDLPTRALLVALNTARSSGSRRSRQDLSRLVASANATDWEDVIALARRVNALPGLRAGLELDEQGRAVVATTGLAEVGVSAEWRLRVASAPRTAVRLEELSRLPWAKRGAVLGRWLFPPVPVLRMRDARAASGKTALVMAYLRRLCDGVRALHSSLHALRQGRRESQ